MERGRRDGRGGGVAGRVARLFALGCLLATAGCEVTGVAAPSGAYAHENAGGLQFPGEPGYNAP